MLGAEADALPEEVRLEVRQFFRINLDWLTTVFEQGMAQGSLRHTGSADVLADTFISLLEGAMLVGRGLPAARGPQSAAAVFLASLAPAH